MKRTAQLAVIAGVLSLACLSIVEAGPDTAYVSYNNWTGTRGIVEYEWSSGAYTESSSTWCSFLDFAPDGTLYGTYAYTLYTIDLTTGVGTEVATLSKYCRGFTIAPDGTAYLVDRTWTGSRYDTDLYTVNLSTGECTSVGIACDVPALLGLEYANGYLYGFNSSSNTLYRMNPANAAGTAIGTASTNMSDLDYGSDGVGSDGVPLFT